MLNKVIQWVGETDMKLREPEPAEEKDPFAARLALLEPRTVVPSPGPDELEFARLLAEADEHGPRSRLGRGASRLSRSGSSLAPVTLKLVDMLGPDPHVEACATRLAPTVAAAVVAQLDELADRLQKEAKNRDALSRIREALALDWHFVADRTMFVQRVQKKLVDQLTQAKAWDAELRAIQGPDEDETLVLRAAKLIELARVVRLDHNERRIYAASGRAERDRTRRP